MPALSGFLLFASLASLGLPPLVNWVGEFMVLIGVFRSNTNYAVIAALGVVLAAIYMLWMYQRVVFGEVKNEANRALPDLSRRELAILVPLAVLVILLGLFSPLLTERTQNTVRTILLQSESPYYELAGPPGKTGAQR